MPFGMQLPERAGHADEPRSPSLHGGTSDTLADQAMLAALEQSDLLVNGVRKFFAALPDKQVARIEKDRSLSTLPRGQE